MPATDARTQLAKKREPYRSRFLCAIAALGSVLNLLADPRGRRTPAEGLARSTIWGTDEKGCDGARQWLDVHDAAKAVDALHRPAPPNAMGCTNEQAQLAFGELVLTDRYRCALDRCDGNRRPGSRYSGGGGSVSRMSRSWQELRYFFTRRNLCSCPLRSRSCLPPGADVSWRGRSTMKEGCVSC